MSNKFDWDTFFKEKTIAVFESGPAIYDIGEGLRARTTSGNRHDKNRAWMQEYIAKVNYQVIDPVPDYKPDIIGDIHKLPLPDNSADGIFCLAVLEHVENPILAMSEMYRVLKPGGRILIYVPFLYYYHSYPGYYHDYWRFTYDTLEMFAKPFNKFEIMPVRLPIETLIRLTPLGRYSLPIKTARWLDTIVYKKGSRQVSGYNFYLEK